MLHNSRCKFKRNSFLTFKAKANVGGVVVKFRVVVSESTPEQQQQALRQQQQEQASAAGNALGAVPAASATTTTTTAAMATSAVATGKEHAKGNAPRSALTASVQGADDASALAADASSCRCTFTLLYDASGVAAFSRLIDRLVEDMASFTQASSNVKQTSP